jgi:hypothetical protein
MSQPISSPSPKQARKPRQKPQRFASIRRECDTGTESLVIRQVNPSGKETADVYSIVEIGTDEATARAFSLTKPDGTVYSCEVSKGFNTCDCKGHSRHNHCKHVESLSALLERGSFGGFPEPRVEADDGFTDEQADALAADWNAALDAA